MGSRKFHLHGGRGGVALAVRVTPRSSRNEITEIQPDGTVKVRLVAAPTEAEANKILVKFLAEVLGAETSQIDIVAGENGRDKLISVFDMDNDEVQQRLSAYIE